MKYSKLLVSGLALLLATSMFAPSVNAKHVRNVRHIQLDSAVSIKPKRRANHHKAKRPARKHAVKRSKKRTKHMTKSQRLFKQGRNAIYTFPYTASSIKQTKKLMHNRTYVNGVKSALRSHFFGRRAYRKSYIKTHTRYALKDFRAYLNGNYHYRMGFYAGSQSGFDTQSEEDHVTKAKRNRSYWKGFNAGLYMSYGPKVNRKRAIKELNHEHQIYADPASLRAIGLKFIRK